MHPTCNPTLPKQTLTLEHRDGNLVGHLGLARVPLGVGPALQNFGRHGISRLVELLHIVKGIEYQKGMLELPTRQFGHGGIGIT